MGKQGVPAIGGGAFEQLGVGFGQDATEGDGGGNVQVLADVQQAEEPGGLGILGPGLAGIVFVAVPDRVGEGALARLAVGPPLFADHVDADGQCLSLGPAFRLRVVHCLLSPVAGEATMDLRLPE